MPYMTEYEIEKSISDIKTTMAVEGLSMSDKSIQTSYDFLRGKISSSEAIDKIKKYIYQKK